MYKKCKISRSTQIAIIFGGVLVLWGFSWWLLIKCFPSYEVRGTFGDMFGAVNALFSGLAFAGLIVTLLFQKDELKLQRKELQATREEMESQRMEFEEQNKTLKRQRFENTFFNMLSLQKEIISDLFYEAVAVAGGPSFEVVQYRSREVFRAIYMQPFGGIRSRLRETHVSELEIPSLLDHYFRHLYRIYKYLDTTNLIDNCERYDYACIIRSQLSEYELIMLFYNCLTGNGREKFKPLVEKYSVFNNLRKDLLVNHDDISLYAESAYNRNSE